MLSEPGPQRRGSSLLQLFLRFNRRLEEITRRLKPDLSVTLNHLLSEVAQTPGTTGGKLTEVLLLDKSSLSRLVSEATKKGLLRSKPSAHDQRRIELRMTPTGAALLNKDLIIRNKQVNECISALSETEKHRLAELLEALADGFHAPTTQPMKGELPARQHIRRLTRVMGFLGSDFLSSGISVETLQVLNAITARGGTMSMTELVSAFPYTQSFTSRLIDTLTERSWVTRHADPNDRRRLNVSLTVQGRSEFNQRYAIAAAALDEAAFAISPHQEELETLLASFLGDVPELSSKESPTITSAIEVTERLAARAAVLEWLVSTGLHRTAPETIISSNETVLVSSFQGTISGVLALTIQEDLLTVHFAATRDPGDDLTMLALFGSAISLSESVTSICVRPPFWPSLRTLVFRCSRSLEPDGSAAATLPAAPFRQLASQNSL